MENFEKIIKEKISSGISISRIPPKTLERFKQMANEEFVSDYGMCLRQLIEDSAELKKLKGIIYNGNLKVILNDNKNL